MLEKKSKDFSNSDDESEYLKEGEPIEGETQVQKKKERTEAQKKAFEKAKEKRRQNLEIKRLEKLKALKESKPTPKSNSKNFNNNTKVL